MLTKYNQLIKEWNSLQIQMNDELKACGFVAVINECRASGDNTKLIDLLKTMEDSPCKAYVKRKLELDSMSIRKCPENRGK